MFTYLLRGRSFVCCCGRCSYQGRAYTVYWLVGVQIKSYVTATICDSSSMLPTCFPQLPTPTVMLLMNCYIRNKLCLNQLPTPLSYTYKRLTVIFTSDTMFGCYSPSVVKIFHSVIQHTSLSRLHSGETAIAPSCIVMLFVLITIMLGFSFIQYTNTWLSHKAFFITRDIDI